MLDKNNATGMLAIDPSQPAAGSKPKIAQTAAGTGPCLVMAPLRGFFARPFNGAASADEQKGLEFAAHSMIDHGIDIAQSPTSIFK
jgi:hypothetical protein